MCARAVHQQDAHLDAHFATSSTTNSSIKHRPAWLRTIFSFMHDAAHAMHKMNTAPTHQPSKSHYPGSCHTSSQSQVSLPSSVSTRVSTWSITSRHRTAATCTMLASSRSTYTLQLLAAGSALLPSSPLSSSLLPSALGRLQPSRPAPDASATSSRSSGISIGMLPFRPASPVVAGAPSAWPYATCPGWPPTSAAIESAPSAAACRSSSARVFQSREPVRLRLGRAARVRL